MVLEMNEMTKPKNIYVAIDLKSFYASVECVERGLDPLTTHLVVADESRTEKTICLAVSPSLKYYGISGRARLFEVIQKVKEVNLQRKINIQNQPFIGQSHDAKQLQNDPYLKLDYIIAPPRMAYYIKYSTWIYEIYLKYVSPNDIHVYSIDEVFIDITHYLKTQNITPYEFTKKMILDIYKQHGIIATAGIGTNLYLCKVAMDIVAKHIQPDKDGVRIAMLNEKKYRQYLWHHQPITDFWRVGKGYAKRLAKEGLYTMGDIAKCSVGKDDEYYNEKLLYDMFGINAELLIDHAWGYESCTIKEIKDYQPASHSIGVGQVLTSPYSFEKGRLILKEMLDLLALDLVDKQIMTKQIVVTVGYDKENGSKYEQLEVKNDCYGRKIPKHTHGTINLPQYTSSSRMIIQEVLKWYDQNVNPFLTIRRFNLSATHVQSVFLVSEQKHSEQMDLFTDYITLQKEEELLKEDLKKELQLQKTTIAIKKKYGKNAILKGMNLEKGATTKIRNKTIGGHQA